MLVFAVGNSRSQTSACPVQQPGLLPQLGGRARSGSAGGNWCSSRQVNGNALIYIPRRAIPAHVVRIHRHKPGVGRTECPPQGQELVGIRSQASAFPFSRPKGVAQFIRHGFSFVFPKVWLPESETWEAFCWLVFFFASFSTPPLLFFFFPWDASLSCSCFGISSLSPG